MGNERKKHRKEKKKPKNRKGKPAFFKSRGFGGKAGLVKVGCPIFTALSNIFTSSKVVIGGWGTTVGGVLFSDRFAYRPMTLGDSSSAKGQY